MTFHLSLKVRACPPKKGRMLVLCVIHEK